MSFEATRILDGLYTMDRTGRGSKTDTCLKMCFSHTINFFYNFSRNFPNKIKNSVFSGL